MSLQVWLPLCGNLDNQGLDPVEFTYNTGATVDTSGKLGSCYYFNGTSHWIRASFDKTQYSGKEISLACWFKCNKVHTPGNIIDLAADLCLGYTYTEGSGVKFYCWRCYSSGGRRTGCSVATSTFYDADTWHHIVATLVGGVTIIYVDGVQSIRVDNSSYYDYNWTPLLGAAYYQISCGKSGGDQNWAGGWLNDFRLYDHALSAKEVSEIAKGLFMHYKLDNHGFGQPNLAFDTYGVFVSNLTAADGSRAEYRARSLGQSLPVTSGSKVRVSFDIHMVFNTARAANTRKLYIYNSNNKGPHYGWTAKEIWYSESIAAGTIRDEHVSYTTTVTSKSNNTLTVDWIEFYSEYGTNNWYSISNLHIEPGEVETPWAPNAQDAMAAILAPTVEDDCSGYKYNADKTNITVNGSTPRYSTSYTFNGSSSYIKVPTNAWMVNGATEMTISVWAKATAWSSWNSRLYSCTESGGFNCEWYSTGSTLSFTQNVYTNAAQSSHGYPDITSRPQILRSDLTEGWHLFTYTYTTSTAKIYLDGVLYQECPYTSYGLYFNKNINLFLGCEASSSNTASSPWYSGQLSDFRLYATALSAVAIKELYETSASIDKDGNVYAREVKEI